MKVKSKIVKLHPLVEQTQKTLQGLNIDDYNVLNTIWSEVISVRCSKNMISRVIRILDAVVKECEKRGYSVGLEHKPWHKRYDTYIEISGHKIEFIIEEPTKRSEHVKTEKETRGYIYIPRFDFTPTGKLALRIDSYIINNRVQKNFSDNRTGKVEDKLAKFFSSLETIAAAEEERRLKDEEQQRLWQIQRQKEIEAEAIKQERLAKIEELETAANNYEKAQRIESYITYLEKLDELTTRQKDQVTLSKNYLLELV